MQSKCENVPGVYGLFDEHGVLIYVGKSKQLRTRLLSYFSPKVRNQKPGRLIRQTRRILWEPAPSEFAALLRELHLIQTWRPSWNVKDMPSTARPTFLCIGRPTAPGVLLSAKPGPYVLATFGPLWPGRRLSRAVEVLNRLFLLRDCANSQPMAFADQAQIFAKELRPGCLRFELKTCLGPCVQACSQKTYSQKVREARRFLEGKSDNAIALLKERMIESAANQHYELAARLRDDLAAVLYLQDRLNGLRAAETDYHFVYPVSSPTSETIWYLIKGGRVAAVTQPPTGAADAKAVRELLDRTFGSTPMPDDLTFHRPDTLLLVMSWFQQNPDEMEQTLSPAQAKKRCRLRRPR